MDNNNIQYTTADLYAPADLKLDITNIDLADKCMDVVFCNHILEHLEDYKIALEELNRILTNRGTLICSVPTDKTSEETVEFPNLKTDEERKQAYGESDHFRNFGLNFPKIIEQYGFKVDILDGDTYPKQILPKIGPGKYDYNKIYVCTKIKDINEYERRKI